MIKYRIIQLRLLCEYELGYAKISNNKVMQSIHETYQSNNISVKWNVYSFFQWQVPFHRDINIEKLWTQGNLGNISFIERIQYWV